MTFNFGGFGLLLIEFLPVNKYNGIHILKSQENYMLIQALNDGQAIIDDSMWVKDMDSKRIIDDYYSGVCPKCQSTNTVKHPINKKLFWGCKDCKFGYWDTYLPMNLRKEFYKVNGLETRLNRYLNELKVIALKKLTEKKVIKPTEKVVQLTLF